MGDLLFKEEYFKIVGAAMRVHSELGPGFLEKVYQEALEVEFKMENIPYLREHPLSIFYKGVLLSEKYAPDFFCYNGIIVELKAVKAITEENYAQVMHYMKATNTKLGILINFGQRSLVHHRIVQSNITVKK